MKSFEGKASFRKKVDLRGRSRVEESREQVLQRTREEREQRRRQKQEENSVRVIKAHWRAYRDLLAARSEIRETWERLYGREGEHLDREPLDHLEAPGFRELVFFVQLSNPHDVQKLAKACECLVHPTQRSREVSHQEEAVLVLRGRRLAALGMKLAIEQCYVEARGSHNGASVQHAALEAIVRCIQALISEAFWMQQGFSSGHLAAALVLAELAGMLPALSNALLAAETALQAGLADFRRLSSPLNKLVLSLASQILKLKHPSVLEHLPQLLFIPLVFSRFPDLHHVQPLLCRAALLCLGEAEARDGLQAWLHPRKPGQTRTLRAAVLLGNLVESGGGIQVQGDPSEAAVYFLKVTQILLHQVQRSILWGAPGMPMDEDEEDDIAGPMSASSGVLSGPEAEDISPDIISQIQGIAAPGILSVLVWVALPEVGTAQPWVWPRALHLVYTLCEMLNTMIDTPCLRQDTLSVLAVDANLVPRLWCGALKDNWASPGWCPPQDDRRDPGWMLPLLILSEAYSTYLSTFGDDYMYEKQRPLPLSELYRPEGGKGLISLLKYCLWQILWVETQPASQGWTERAKALRDRLLGAAAGVLGALNSRNCRRPFAPAAAFQTEDLPPARFHAEVRAAAASLGGLMEARHTRVWAVLTHAPFLIAFEERAQVFQTVIAADRAKHREMGAYGPQSFVTIRRDTLMQDAFEHLGRMDEELRSRIRIQYVDTYGEVEAGVDGGGLFKDFMENLVKEGFNPEVGLFRTTAEQKLFPSPAAALVVANALALFEFLGKMLGKAMYEGILLELPLAGFFLKKLLHKSCDLNDLPSLDAELYKQLLFLRDYDGDVEDLALTFTATDSALGQNTEIELVPGGRSRPVTGNNRLEYIHRVAHFMLNAQSKRTAEAFRAGLEKVIPEEWLRMFNEQELQALIGGGDHQGLDLVDMRAHVNYAGGYTQEHPVIERFWEALQDFTPDQQKAFLRFVTACSRPPLLGFKYLDPALCIQMAGGVLDGVAQERLPSSSTCINLLKMPPYNSTELLRSKLLFAIKNVAGFDLS